MPQGKGLHTTGAWSPQLLGPASAAYTSGLSPSAPSGSRGGRLVRQGPTNLDLECKAALHKLLRPSNYNIVEPWLIQAPLEAKKDVVKMERQLAAFEREAAEPRKAYGMSQERVIKTEQGREKLACKVQVTADRQQHDLLRNRCGSDAKDRSLEAKRQFVKNFAPIPNQDSVHQMFCLQDMPLGSSDAVKVLTEEARRRLGAWQVRGPERNKEATACVMRALRAINQAVAGMPTYRQHMMQQYPGGQGCTDSLNDYAYVAPRSLHRHSRSLPSVGQPNATLSHSLSCPTVFKPYIDPQEVEDVKKPGGFIIDMFKDEIPMHFVKNRERGMRRIHLGSPTDWSTTNEVHNRQVAIACGREP